MLAGEGDSVWFQTCLNYFSKQHKMRCIGLMGHVETKPEVAPDLFLPLFWSRVNYVLILDSFQRPLHGGWSPNGEVCLHHTYTSNLKGYRWQLHHSCHECSVSYSWSLHSVRKSSSARKKVNNPVKASFYYGIEKYIFLCLLIGNVANNSFSVKDINGGKHCYP